MNNDWIKVTHIVILSTCICIIIRAWYLWHTREIACPVLRRAHEALIRRQKLNNFRPSISPSWSVQYRMSGGSLFAVAIVVFWIAYSCHLWLLYSSCEELIHIPRTKYRFRVKGSSAYLRQSTTLCRKYISRNIFYLQLGTCSQCADKLIMSWTNDSIASSLFHPLLHYWFLRWLC